MIGIGMPYFWCLATGVEPVGPTAEQVQQHMDKVYGGDCEHHAVELNGRLELVTCPNCAD